MESKTNTATVEHAATAEHNRAAFEKVWKKVMPYPRHDSPIILNEEVPAEEAPVTYATAAPTAPTVSAANAPNVPSVSAASAESAAPNVYAASAESTAPNVSAAPLATAPVTKENMLAEAVTPITKKTAAVHEIACLGNQAVPYGSHLQAFIMEELRNCHLYLSMACRMHGQRANTLRTLGMDARQHAARLSAAYFILSGVRYWPTQDRSCCTSERYMVFLRTQFLSEQQRAAAYRETANATQDTCLRELLNDLAEECDSHTRILRSLLEQVMQ
ncbi:MAG: hypothetical protein LIO58_09230 [Oscillospiraceae bacterium]|nr:hypothetical protein [Oscillospiraceae bacterium]